MYIVELAASGARLPCGAIAQSPLVDGLAAAMMVPPARSLRLLSLAVQDRVGSLLGPTPSLPGSPGAGGELALSATPDALFGQGLMTPKDSTEWHNRVAARSLLSFSWRRPVRHAASIRCPILLIIAKRKRATRWRRPAPRCAAPNEPHAASFIAVAVVTTTSMMGRDFDDAVRVELEFLQRHAKTPAP